MKKIMVVLLGVVVLGLGCALPERRGGSSVVSTAQLTEPAWVRNGEPLVFEGENWFPMDEVENLLDNEVYQAGAYRETAFFIEKRDVRPFDRIYTFFSKNRYRAFEP